MLTRAGWWERQDLGALRAVRIYGVARQNTQVIAKMWCGLVAGLLGGGLDYLVLECKLTAAKCGSAKIERRSSY